MAAATEYDRKMRELIVEIETAVAEIQRLQNLAYFPQPSEPLLESADSCRKEPIDATPSGWRQIRSAIAAAFGCRR